MQGPGPAAPPVVLWPGPGRTGVQPHGCCCVPGRVGGAGGAWDWGGRQKGVREAMRQRILSHRTPPCHRRPIMARE